MAGVFIRPEFVIEPGLSQMGAALLILIPTLGITFSLQGRFADRVVIDVPARLTLAAFSLLALLHPDVKVAIPALLPVCLFRILAIATPSRRIQRSEKPGQLRPASEV